MACCLIGNILTVFVFGKRVNFYSWQKPENAEHQIWINLWTITILDVYNITAVTLKVKETRYVDSTLASEVTRSLCGTSTHPTMVTKSQCQWVDNSHPFCTVSIGLPIPEIRLFHTLTLKHQSDQQFLRYSYLKIWPWKIQGQGHGWGKIKVI